MRTCLLNLGNKKNQKKHGKNIKNKKIRKEKITQINDFFLNKKKMLSYKL